NHLKSIAPGSAGLFVCDNPTAFKPWLLGRPDIGSFEGETVNTLLRPQYMPLLERFDFCWLAITRNNASSAASLVSRIGPMLRRGGLLLVSVDEEALEDRRQALADVLNMNLDVESVHYVAESSVVAALRQALKGLYGLAMTPPWTPVAVLAAVPLSLIASGWNMVFGRPRKSFQAGRVRGASVVIAMRRPMRSDHVMPLPDHLDPETPRHPPSMDAAALVLLLKHELAAGRAAHEPADIEFATVGENLIEACEFLARFKRDRGSE